MLSLHTNAAALATMNSLGANQKELARSQTQLGTGYRVNSSMDDAAGLQIATRLDAQSRGMTVASRNTQNATSMLQTADGALNELANVLLRMKDLATQAADDASNATDRTAMQAEFDALALESFNILNNTKYGGTKLLQGGTMAAALTFQIGASSAEKMSFDVSTDLTTLDTSLTGISTNYAAASGGAGAEITTQAGANTMIDTISDALDDLGTVRGGLGAAGNRLDHVYNNLQNITSNTQNARGRIMDVDYAGESANMTAHQMLLQAGTSMLKQSNSLAGLTMSLLQ